MIFEYLKAGIELTDAEFDMIYPTDIQPLSKRHFTPLNVAKMAAEYLVLDKNTRILDIGSGVGKFCMIGAACTKGHFTGVEQRENLHLLSKEIAEKYELTNTHFIHGNIMDIDFTAFDAFYFFNPFFENILTEDSIDKAFELSKELFYNYSIYVRRQLSKLPIGTKLVTYFAVSEEIPLHYTVISTHLEGRLKMWEKRV
jgi:16S rRNA A1518/A1519 N6-dimethyltransferase RsmA/KsgA/DIM1 with predicted DNA glycosylase/AP lyase activity